MKRFSGLKKVLDGFNQLNGPNGTQTDGAPSAESEINDRLSSDDFTLAKVFYFFSRICFHFPSKCKIYVYCSYDEKQCLVLLYFDYQCNEIH